MKFLVIIMCALAAAASAKPATPNQKMDVVVKKLNDIIRNEKKWCVSKKVQRTDGELPLTDQGNVAMGNEINVKDITMTGLCDLRRSKSATYDSTKKQLTSTFVAEDVSLKLDMAINITGGGEASAEYKEKVTEVKFKKVFADVVIDYDDEGKPTNLASYDARVGQFNVVTNDFTGSEYASVQAAAVKEGFSQIMINQFNTNIKAQLRASIIALSA